MLNETPLPWTPLPPPILQKQLFEMAKAAFENPAM
jgi:hypothetical protein